jgi:hypothetical protein
MVPSYWSNPSRAVRFSWMVGEFSGLILPSIRRPVSSLGKCSAIVCATLSFTVALRTISIVDPSIEMLIVRVRLHAERHSLHDMRVGGWVAPADHRELRVRLQAHASRRDTASVEDSRGLCSPRCCARERPRGPDVRTKIKETQIFTVNWPHEHSPDMIRPAIDQIRCDSIPGHNGLLRHLAMPDFRAMHCVILGSP